MSWKRLLRDRVSNDYFIGSEKTEYEESVAAKGRFQNIYDEASQAVNNTSWFTKFSSYVRTAGRFMTSTRTFFGIDASLHIINGIRMARNVQSQTWNQWQEPHSLTPGPTPFCQKHPNNPICKK